MNSVERKKINALVLNQMGRDLANILAWTLIDGDYWVGGYPLNYTNPCSMTELTESF